jgi:aldose 1-epimerase
MSLEMAHGLHRADERLVLESDGARAIIAPGLGGRLASLVVDGSELLVTEAPDPVLWGAFPMVPFAGRIRNGQFSFGGRDYQLERKAGPHAIHGTVHERRWTVTAPAELSIDLGPGWPFAGHVTQRFALSEDRFRVSLTLEADEPMPGSIGWHPTFRRWLRGSTDAPAADSAPVRLRFDADTMYVRDAAGIPTGKTAAPKPHPWDDCFTGPHSAPALTWPDTLRVEITSSTDYWVVYDEPPHCVCVEPQTSIPDFVNLAPVMVEPGQPLEAWMEWRWSNP